MSIDHKELTPAVERAAGIAKYSFPSHHDVADVKQAIWVWIMENQDTVSRILGERNSQAVLISYLVRVAQEHLKTEDAQSYGYAEEDRFYYSLDLIKSILETVFRYEDWQSFSTRDNSMPRAKANPATSGDSIAAYVDVKSAAEKLPEDQYNAIIWRYKYGLKQEAIGHEMNLSRDGVRWLLEGAVRSIQKTLGQRDLSELRRGYEGRTEPRNSASAVARTEHDYEG